MFEYLKIHSQILVTGPQRSGTTICAKMISVDAGLKFYGEERVNIAELQTLKNLIQKEDNFVIQCPSLCRYAHELDIPVVFMIRDYQEIIASEKRVGWQGHRKLELKRYGLTKGNIAQVKFDYWRKYQRDQIKYWYEIAYNSLKKHPLWIPKERRKNFGPRQISEG